MQIKTFLDLIIPQYLLIPVVSILSSYLIINQKLPDGLSLILLIAGLSAAIIGFNILNMILDENLDAINKPNRPIPAKKITKHFAGIMSIIFYLLAIIISIFVNYFFTLIILAFIIISYLYTAPPFTLRKNILGTPITGILVYGTIPFLSAASISTVEIPMIFLFLFSFLIGSISIIKDIEDIQGEKKFRIKTIANTIGKKKTFDLSIYSLFLIGILIIIASITNYINLLFIFPSIILFISLIYLRQIFNTEIKFEEKLITTQSKILTKTMIIILTLQLIFGITSLFT